jgi:flagellar assembly factor FliW
LKVFKKISFWLTIIAIVVVLYNIMGKDDKNLLLFFLSPPFWVTEYYSFQVPFTLLYSLNITFWFVFGLVLDFGISKLLRR